MHIEPGILAAAKLTAAHIDRPDLLLKNLVETICIANRHDITCMDEPQIVRSKFKLWLAMRAGIVVRFGLKAIVSDGNTRQRHV